MAGERWMALDGSFKRLAVRPGLVSALAPYGGTLGTEGVTLEGSEGWLSGLSPTAVSEAQRALGESLSAELGALGVSTVAELLGSQRNNFV